MTREDVSFDSAGVRCAAWLYRPSNPGADPGRRPCIVLGHGFGGTREARLDAYAERFAAVGLWALVFDYRHFGASAGEPRQLLDLSSQLQDWRSAIAFARSLEGVDPQQICLWGTSFSGGHVLESAATDGKIAAVVAQVPFVDGLATMGGFGLTHTLNILAAGLRDEVSSRLGLGPYYVPIVGAPGTLAVMTSPDAEPGYRSLLPPQAQWRNEVAARIVLRVGTYRPITAASKLRCPLLVCVCTEDVITPADAAARAVSFAPDGELIRYPGGHFDIYTPPLFETAIRDQIEFLRRRLHLVDEKAA